ncbi:MAG: hypothetical protein IPI50_09800 [Saprospiraceae bacterium]|nr:hypothetical protein [Saprospiraceae bacterium]
MRLQIFSILVEVKENMNYAYFVTYKVQANNIETAINLLYLEKELQDKVIRIEEIETLIGIPISDSSNRIIECSGKSYFSLE